MANNRTDFFLNHQQIQTQNFNRASLGAQQQQFQTPLASFLPAFPLSFAAYLACRHPGECTQLVLTVDSTLLAAPSLSAITISGTNRLHELEEEQELDLRQEQGQEKELASPGHAASFTSFATEASYASAMTTATSASDAPGSTHWRSRRSVESISSQYASTAVLLVRHSRTFVHVYAPSSLERVHSSPSAPRWLTNLLLLHASRNSSSDAANSYQHCQRCDTISPTASVIFD